MVIRFSSDGDHLGSLSSTEGSSVSKFKEPPFFFSWVHYFLTNTNWTWKIFKSLLPWRNLLSTWRLPWYGIWLSLALSSLVPSSCIHAAFSKPLIILFPKGPVCAMSFLGSVPETAVLSSGKITSYTSDTTCICEQVLKYWRIFLVKNNLWNLMQFQFW